LRVEENVMRRLSVSAIVVAAGWGFGSMAYAADPVFEPPQQAYVVKEFLSGWYVRGDFSYRLVGTPGGSVSSASSFVSSYDDALGYGAGVGYKVNWFRADVTVDGSRSSFVGNTPFAAPDVTAKVTTVTALANAYLDLGSWSHFTPYVGGGLGFSFLKAAGIRSASGLLINGNPTYDFAWAVMAGASYEVTRNFLIDTGYRFLHAGAPTATLMPVGTLNYGAIEAHEFRVGLRYMID
jgi:opacity protein-like surface antigen